MEKEIQANRIMASISDGIKMEMKILQTIQNMASMGFTPYQQQNNNRQLSSGRQLNFQFQTSIQTVGQDQISDEKTNTCANGCPYKNNMHQLRLRRKNMGQCK